MSKTLHGQIDVAVGDITYELRPTLAAVRVIESRLNGLRGASAALHAVSVDAAAIVIAAGADITGEKAQELPEAVWQHGVAEITPRLIEFLGALYNPRGGKPGK